MDIYAFKIQNAKSKEEKKASAGKKQVILHEFRVIQTDFSLACLESRMWDSLIKSAGLCKSIYSHK